MAAYEEAGILHRDISVGNILIDPKTRCGFLIDWDLSRLVSELGDGPMEPDRTVCIPSASTDSNSAHVIGRVLGSFDPHYPFAIPGSLTVAQMMSSRSSMRSGTWCSGSTQPT